MQLIYTKQNKKCHFIVADLCGWCARVRACVYMRVCHMFACGTCMHPACVSVRLCVFVGCAYMRMRVCVYARLCVFVWSVYHSL